jgi:hypothetical protein
MAPRAHSRRRSARRPRRRLRRGEFECIHARIDQYVCACHLSTLRILPPVCACVYICAWCGAVNVLSSGAASVRAIVCARSIVVAASMTAIARIAVGVPLLMLCTVCGLRVVRVLCLNARRLWSVVRRRAGCALRPSPIARGRGRGRDSERARAWRRDEDVHGRTHHDIGHEAVRTQHAHDRNRSTIGYGYRLAYDTQSVAMMISWTPTPLRLTSSFFYSPLLYKCIPRRSVRQRAPV